MFGAPVQVPGEHLDHPSLRRELGFNAALYRTRAESACNDEVQIRPERAMPVSLASGAMRPEGKRGGCRGYVSDTRPGCSPRRTAAAQLRRDLPAGIDPFHVRQFVRDAL